MIIRDREWREPPQQQARSRPCLPSATRAVRSLQSQSCTLVHTLRLSRLVPRPLWFAAVPAPLLRDARLRLDAPLPSTTRERRRPKAAAARGEGGGCSGAYSMRVAVARLSVGVDCQLVAGGRVATHTNTHRGMRACVSVCACTTVRPLAWAVALTLSAQPLATCPRPRQHRRVAHACTHARLK